MDIAVEILTLGTGAVLGGVGGALWASARSRARAAAAEAEARSERLRREQVEEELRAVREASERLGRQLAVAEERVAQAAESEAAQDSFLRDARARMEGAFRALATETLEGGQKQLLALAEQRLAASRAEGAADLDARTRAVAELVAPVRETLVRLETRTGELERARADAHGRIEQQVDLLRRSAESLGRETATLSGALRNSQARGRWGEMALRNVVEAAGMTEHCDFEVQVTLPGGGRPDLLVHLPGGRRIAVDAKAPLDAFLRAAEAATDADRDQALDAHVAALRGHVRALADREYARAIAGDVDLVVLFLPGDPFLAAAFARAPDLQEEALRRKVLVATPTTLVALLRTVAVTWQERAMAENAREVAETARELHRRGVRFAESLARIGKGLRGAVEAYDRAVGSYERRLLPMGRKLEDLGAVGDLGPLTAPPSVGQVPAPREPTSGDAE